MRSRLFLSLSLTLTIMMAGCAGIPGNLQPAGSTTRPSTPPFVVTVGDQTNGVAPNRAIDVQFSTAMDATTINSSTFFVRQAGTQASLPGVVSYDTASHIASYKPTSDFLPLTSYSAVVTTAVATAGGAHLQVDFAFSFQTRATTDRSPIAVLATSPVNGASCVSPTTNITITFTEGADPATVNTSTIRVSSTVAPISGTVTYNASTITATFTPSGTLTPPVITVTVQGVTDLAGVPMAGPFTFGFNDAPCNAVLPPACPLTYATFDVPNHTQITVRKINDAGAIVGSVGDTGQGFLFQNGSFTFLSDPAAAGGGATSAGGIANNGLITGSFTKPDGTVHGFIFQNGTFTNFDIAGDTRSAGINSAGVTVGTVTIPTGFGWVRNPDGSHSTLQDSTLPGFRGPSDVNDTGVIVGIAPGVSFIDANGAFTYFQVPGAATSSANGLNNAGEVVGDFLFLEQGQSHAAGYLKNGDSFCTVQVPNAPLTNADDINGSGVIVGNFVDSNNVQHGFIATPK